MLKLKTLTKPEDSIQDIRFTTVCLDLRGTAMPKDNKILDELYDLFRGFMRQYSNLNPAGEVIHGHNKTEFLIIPVRNNSSIQRHQLERINRLNRFHLLVVHSQMNTSTR